MLQNIILKKDMVFKKEVQIFFLLNLKNWLL